MKSSEVKSQVCDFEKSMKFDFGKDKPLVWSLRSSADNTKTQSAHDREAIASPLAPTL